jgi:hypothetical protein
MSENTVVREHCVSKRAVVQGAVSGALFPSGLFLRHCLLAAERLAHA